MRKFQVAPGAVTTQYLRIHKTNYLDYLNAAESYRNLKNEIKRNQQSWQPNGNTVITLILHTPRPRPGPIHGLAVKSVRSGRKQPQACSMGQ